MSGKHFGLFILLFLGSVNAFSTGSSSDSSQAFGQLLKSDSLFSLKSPRGYIPSLVHDFGEQITAPFHMTTKDMIWVGGAIGVTALLFHYDYEIDEWIKPSKDKNEWISESSPQISELGNNYAYAFVAGFALGSAVLEEHKALQTSLLASQAMITSGTWARVIKTLTGRERPSASYCPNGHPGGYWYGPFKEYDEDVSAGKNTSFFDAFPSGHTSTAFSIATVFAMQYHDSKVIPVLAYTTATLVGISRMTEHTHWASDVFAGACLGYLCGKQVVLHHRKLYSSASVTQQTGKFTPELLIAPSPDVNGLAFTMRW